MARVSRQLSPDAREALEALELAAADAHQRQDDNWPHDPHGMGRFVTRQILNTIRASLGKEPIK